ncbi:hypothetical protein DH2020_020834 [Rehmannia glutinosa]|uniref:Glycosyltransferase n=1 Tax=Rehmannia glutinosa TaxID=99300 RepID=A0ABR0WCG6_REHGL
MAQGHIIPFLSLALKLEQEKGYSITFVNTPLNIQKLRQDLPKASTIRLIEIPFDATEHGLPPDSDAAGTLPPQLIRHFVDSSVALKPAFRNLISDLADGGNPPLCVISDMFFAWSAEVAHEFGTLHAIFNAGAGYGMAGWHATWLNMPHLKNPNSDELYLPGFPKGYRFQTKNLPREIANGPWKFRQEIFRKWKETDAMLFNTVEEFDEIGLTYFRENFPNCSVYAIGPILSKARSEEEDNATTNHKKWLDSKPKKSVLYVAFGSQYSPSETQTMELAKALEASNVNFLWVLRPPASSSITDSFSDNYSENKDFFPTGFEERIKTSKKGLLLKKWAPQMEILSHESIGAFLSHCGWNSIIEALSNGVPMLAWSMGAEQPFNAKFLEEEMGVSIWVANGVSIEVKHEEIVKKIELIMKDDDEGNVMRRKACEVKQIIQSAIKDEEQCKGSSVKALEDFLTTCMQMRKKV